MICNAEKRGAFRQGKPGIARALMGGDSEPDDAIRKASTPEENTVWIESSGLHTGRVCPIGDWAVGSSALGSQGQREG